MSQSLSPEIRAQIVEALYPVKAYQLPAVCERFGLGKGDEAEARDSKRKYILVRIEKVGGDRLVKIAREVVQDYPHHGLREALRKLDEQEHRQITEITRRRLCQLMNTIELSDDNELLDFLREIWPIDSMPSTYDIESNCLADDIHRHMIRFSDWSNEELLSHLGIKESSQELLFRFIEAVVQSKTRSEAEQRRIVGEINSIIRRDGFALVQTGLISGYPIFSVRQVQAVVNQPADLAISDALSAFDYDGVHSAWVKALDRRSTDPEGAITAARTLLETVCKRIIEEAGGEYGASDDLPKLWYTAATHLNLAPDQHTETAFKTILGSCGAIVNNLSNLRNRLSDAHGKGKKPARPLPRHAALAVNLAGAMAMYLVSTWEARSRPEKR